MSVFQMNEITANKNCVAQSTISNVSHQMNEKNTFSRSVSLLCAVSYVYTYTQTHTRIDGSAPHILIQSYIAYTYSVHTVPLQISNTHDYTRPLHYSLRMCTKVSFDSFRSSSSAHISVRKYVSTKKRQSFESRESLFGQAAIVIKKKKKKNTLTILELVRQTTIKSFIVSGNLRYG